MLVGEPTGYRARLAKVPENVSFAAEPSVPVDLIQLFVTSKKELESQLGKVKSILKPEGILWVTYPQGDIEIQS